MFREGGSRASWGMVVLLAGVLASACARTVDPRTSGGERLPDSDGVRGTSPECFCLAPDGRFLLFESLRDTGMLPAFTLYDLGARVARPVAWGNAAAEAVREGHGPRADSPCRWRDEGVEVDGDAGRTFTLVVTSSAPEWGLRAPGAQTGAGSSDGSAAPPEAAQATFTVVRRSDRAADIVKLGAEKGPPAAQHAAEDAAASGLDIVHLRLSPHGRRLAYVVSEHQQAFLLPPRAYVLDLSRPGEAPVLLAAPVLGAPRWLPDGSGLLACVGGGPQTRGLYLWRLVG